MVDPTDIGPEGAPKSPEKDLAVDVLRMAIEDLKRPGWREQVQRWIADHGRFRMPFPMACELAGLDPATVRGALNRRTI